MEIIDLKLSENYKLALPKFSYFCTQLTAFSSLLTLIYLKLSSGFYELENKEFCLITTNQHQHLGQERDLALFEKGRNISQFILQDQNYSDTNNRKLQTHISHKHICKILNKILANQIQQYIKSKHSDQCSLFKSIKFEISSNEISEYNIENSSVQISILTN